MAYFLCKFKIISSGIYRIYALAIIAFTLLPLGFGQDVHFTMFNSAPLFVNPSNTGNFNGDWRVAGNYRNQWLALASPYNTATVSFDNQFYVLNQNVSAGLLIVTDHGGGSAGLSFNKAYASLGFNHFLNENYFSYGLQVGVVIGGVSENQTAPGQWDPVDGEYDPNIFVDETNPGNIVYPDLNFGVTWKRNIHIFEPEIGFSLFHLNNPKKSFYGSDEKLPIRFGINSQVKTKLSDKLYLMPLFYYSNHKTATETILGAHLGVNVFGNLSSVREIKAGAYLRNGLAGNVDAIAITVGAEISRLEINICYDLNISEFSAATNNQGAFEISFIYKSISTVLNSYSIPCERF